MQILKGAPVAKHILESVALDIQTLGIQPTLAIILIGNDEGSLSYIGRKQAAAQKVGILCVLYHLPEETTQETLIALMQQLNDDQHTTGYIVQLPLPAHIDPAVIFQHITREKDVDGFHPHNIGELFLHSPEHTYLPAATSRAVMKLFSHYSIELAGKEVCILGKGPIVGRPLALELLHEGATVTVCHSRTMDVSKHLRDADIVVAAVGKAHMLDSTQCKAGCILVDVGFSKKEGAIYGDILPPDKTSSIGGFVPVPGGIGPITVAVLMENVVKAYKIQYPSDV